MHAKQIFTSFPDENAEGPSKAQLKKMAKLQELADKKAAKKGGQEETKDTKETKEQPQIKKEDSKVSD